MTVSRPDSGHLLSRRLRTRARLFASVAALSLMVPMAVSAQDQTPKPAEPQKPVVQTPAVQDPDKPKETYFLGGTPKPKRQEGPAIGAPKSILPKPFVAPGSVKVPPAPASAATPDMAAAGQAQTADQQAGQQTGQPPVQDQAVAPAQAETETGTPISDEPLVEGSLSTLDPSGVSVLSGTVADGTQPVAAATVVGYPATFWQGYSRSQVETALKAVVKAAASPESRQIADRLVRSPMALPAPQNDADITSFIATRLDLLEQLGDVDGYVALIDALPKGRDWTALARHITNADLLEGRLPDACSRAEAVRATDSNPYWVRMAAFCHAANGDRTGVDFQLGILEEVTKVPKSFYQLMDRILVEAEQPKGTVLPPASALGEPLRVDLLEMAMARLAKVKVAALSLEDVNPLAVHGTLALPGVDQGAKADLMSLALQKGWVGGQAFADFARAFQPTDADRAELTGETEGDQFITDVVLAHTAATAANAPDRVAALKKAWDRAVRVERVLAEAPGLYRLTADMIASPDDGAAAPALARAAMLDRANPEKGGWFRLMRATPQDAEGQLGDALINTWPLMLVATGDSSLPPITLDRLHSWWLAQGNEPTRFGRASLMFTILDALGYTVPDTAWSWLEAGDVHTEHTAPSAAIWRRLLVAGAEGNKPQVLETALKLISDGGPSAVSPALAGSLIATLRSAGFEKEARALATEMLVAWGL
ncbi:hypothetical protein [Kordiimonas marina]|uniref:hypothetical protein n=1 Tax=Kordiimonas marina TaxID=2872312 RepID=UPI001FF10031|nr:hypothetical protein [Kordiimonas marina]MCJ9430487.1 hypothetical protein [Kordiimonas marina]